MKFPFKSKLERHLQSSDHKMFTDCLQGMVDDDYECDLYVDTYSQEVAMYMFAHDFLSEWCVV